MGDNARGHGHHLVTTWGRVPVQKGESESRSEEAARSNRSESLVSVPVTPQWCAQEAADQAARAPWPPALVANMVEGHHEGVLHAVCGR